MDAIKFIRERNRMCEMYRLKRCEGCPANNPNNYGGEGVACIMIDKIDAERLVPIVEKWAAAHPHKTRQSVFLEQYPDAKIDDNGVIAICPTAFSSAYRDDIEKCPWVACSKCRHDFWSQEVK